MVECAITYNSKHIASTAQGFMLRGLTVVLTRTGRKVQYRGRMCDHTGQGKRVWTLVVAIAGFASIIIGVHMTLVEHSGVHIAIGITRNGYSGIIEAARSRTHNCLVSNAIMPSHTRQAS